MKKVLIIGAGFLQSFVIKKAKELGYFTLAVDANPNAEGFKYCDEYAVINIVDEKACCEFAQSQNIDGVLTAATDYGVLTAAYIAEKLKLPGLKYETAKVIKNKYLVRKKLYEMGADDTGKCYEISDIEELVEIREDISFPVMVKPCDGSGSRGAAKVDFIEELETACAAAMSNSLTHKAIIEPFIFGKEYGVESFCYNDEKFVLGVMEKQMTNPPYYAELGHCIPSGLPQEVEEKIKRCVKKALEALDINFGSVNMDLLLAEDNNVHIVDIGARMGGNLIGSHIIPYGTGICYIENMIKAAVGDCVDFSSVMPKICVATRLLALTPGKVKALPDFEKIEEEYGVEIEHHLKAGDVINEYHTNLDGCGYVVSRQDNKLLATSNAAEALKKVDNEIILE